MNWLKAFEFMQFFSDFFECFSNKYLKCTYQKIAAVSDSLNARRPTEKSLKTISHAAKFWATFGWKTKSVFVDWQKWTTRRWIENWNLRNPSSLQRLNSGGCEGYHWWLKQNWQRWNFLMFFRTRKLSIICLSLNGHPSRGSCRNVP